MAKASFFVPDLITLHIDDVAFGGKGVGRTEGKVVFVPFTVPGETVTAQIVKQKKNFAEAALLSVQDESGDRVPPPCPYFGRCGGCSYQHMSYERQLGIKARQVEQTLRRVGRLAEVPMRAIIPSPSEYGYRNRIRVHVSDGVVGFYAFDRHELIDIEQCPIAMPEVNAELRKLRGQQVQDGDYTLSARERERFFSQTNDAVAAELLAVVRDIVKDGQASLVDAYCGSGFFAKQLAHLFKSVCGIEENEFAVARARRNAAPHEQYIAGDVATHLGEVLREQSLDETTLLLDPPALGLEPRVLDFVLGSPPREIIYVSCNPATLARDLAGLSRDYALQSVTPLDMFPQTAEIEVVAHLLRRQP
ncbi:MAG: rRNA (uracil1939-C5)-methyltransferase [Chthoniobacter sp.]|nr:rRNA (uracil1939-C5)-methyltransferase [Chthoniobacter sp.]